MQQEPRQGLPPIQYVQQPMPQPPQKSGNSGLIGFIIAVVVAAAVSYGMMQFVGVKKADITAIQNTVAAFGVRLTAQEGRAIPADQASAIADLQAKYNNIPTAVNSVPKADYDALAAKVTALETWKTGLGTATPTTPSGITGTYGELVDSDGSLELWLEKTGGDADSEEVHTSDKDDNTANFTLNIVNKDTASRHYFNAILTFTLQDGEDTITLKAGQTSEQMSDADNVMELTATPTTGTREDGQSVEFRSNKLNVAKGDVETYKIWTYIDQSAGGSAYWDIDYRIDDKGD